MEYEITVTAASGVEGVTKRELKRLGVEEPRAVGGAMTFTGDETMIARCNMFLRTADRVYLGVGRFRAETFDQLFDGIYSLPWEAFLPADALVTADGKSVKSKLFALSACQSIVKKAIVSRLEKAYRRSDFPETGARYMVEFSILKDVVSVRLNTSGAGLHKRGYRDLVGRAPLKETLAAAMVLLSDFYYLRPFADPFCGSGTIVIEAARIALNVASGIGRDFDFRHWDFFDPSAYARAANAVPASFPFSVRISTRVPSDWRAVTPNGREWETPSASIRRMSGTLRALSRKASSSRIPPTASGF